MCSHQTAGVWSRRLAGALRLPWGSKKCALPSLYKLVLQVSFDLAEDLMPTLQEQAVVWAGLASSTAQCRLARAFCWVLSLPDARAEEGENAIALTRHAEWT